SHQAKQPKQLAAMNIETHGGSETGALELRDIQQYFAHLPGPVAVHIIDIAADHLADQGVMIEPIHMLMRTNMATITKYRDRIAHLEYLFHAVRHIEHYAPFIPQSLDDTLELASLPNRQAAGRLIKRDDLGIP